MKSKTNKENSTRRSKRSALLSNTTLPSPEAPLSPFVRRFIKRVQNTVHTFSLWKAGDAFIVGVSGGPDSMCLLDVLFLLSKKYRFLLHVAHVNYHLRGKASNLDQALTQKMCWRYGIPCAVFSCRKPLTSASEEMLRMLRYDFFEKLRQKTGADAILIAHNRDDQAETLLLRLLRGSGLAGLSAMRPKNRSVIRPLIETSRADIMRYVQERSLTFREDMSNRSPRYLRNRIRHELIPFLERRFQPQTRKLLAQTATLLGDEYALLQEKSPALFPESGNKRSGLTYSRTALLKLSGPELLHALRTLLRPLLSGKSPEKQLLHEIVKSIQSNKNKPRTVTFKGLKLVCKGDTVRLLNNS